MNKVLTFGVFDYFHIGHLKLFRQCREYGDFLIVGVQNGEHVAQFKAGQAPLYSTEERVEMIEALRIVDKVFVYDILSPDLLDHTEFDILALGEDHVGGRFDVLTKWCYAHGKSVIRLKRTPGISSSSMKKEVWKKGREK